MTPIIEGLDGVQKMSKSLGNAIGIHEPAQEMYGKLMSISDELMWRYWILLTDLRQSDIERMQAEVSAGTLHPMEAKKALARTIVAGFHSEDAARRAEEDWSRQFQQRDLSAITDEAKVDFRRVVVADAVSLERAVGDRSRTVHIHVAKLLVELGLKNSRAEADRQVSAGVNIDGVTSTDKLIKVERRPARIAVRVGKRAKIAIIE
jgi:tyrosyl-tRNA synthetase